MGTPQGKIVIARKAPARRSNLPANKAVFHNHQGNYFQNSN
jgi:hypothetical protein